LLVGSLRSGEIGRVQPNVTVGFRVGGMLDREPTSHERSSGQSWDASYQNGPAPWDFGGPQPAVVELEFSGRVLDAGCGGGENALHIAALGLPVLGFDVAPTALALACERAESRGLPAEFVEADALQLERLGREFDTVLDCGLFHTFDASEKAAYAASLASVTSPGATVYVLCFRPGLNAGPHPVTEGDLRDAFTQGWEITAITQNRIRTRYHDADGAPAWLAIIKRVELSA
jgi:SAM-dependent methyltransferase